MVHRRRWQAGPTRAALGVVAAIVVVAAGCSWQRSDDADPQVASGEMRTVPTVTVAPSSPSGSDDVTGSAGDVTGPPPEEVVGDLPPDPDNPEPRPPLPDGPTIDACTRLTDVAAADAVAATVGTAATSVALGVDACRLTAGAVVVEVHYVAEATVFDDWFAREGIDTVGEVGPDAVGLTMWVPPGGAPASGYTIAMVSRRQGAVVAVTGSTADRALAVQVALAVAATT